MDLSSYDLLLIRRAMILLSCILTGKESENCLEIAEKITSEYRVRKMLDEDEKIRGE